MSYDAATVAALQQLDRTSIAHWPGLETTIGDESVLERTIDRFRQRNIKLPSFAELTEPSRIPAEVRAALGRVSPDDADPINLFRVHWYNDSSRRDVQTVPAHVVLPPQLTGVEAPIVVMLGDRFPMIGAHKVLATYGCLAPRIITGRFDPTSDRAVWPSTGNYCRGGIAVSRLMSSRGVAVLPQGMSRERFEWLEKWAEDSGDIVATPGTESNVKEIYDRCAILAEDPDNVIFNQFSEFGNHLAHFQVTGAALGRVFEHLGETRPGARLAAFVSATGSAGTLAAGDNLAERYGAKVVAVEALECPTMLYNGFGEHNIQGIGDKHIPFIHNVYNTDVVVAVSDQATDRLAVTFDSKEGRRYLHEKHGVPQDVLASLGHFGLSAICNIVAAAKTAKLLGLGADDVILTVATDGAALYRSELERIAARDFPHGFDVVDAAESFSRYMLGAGTDHALECTQVDRARIFNLGYYTWVEQQGVTLERFEARRSQDFWRSIRGVVPVWDDLIRDFNDRTGVTVG